MDTRRVLACTLLCGLLAACTPDQPDAPRPVATSTSPGSATPSPTTTPSASVEPAAAPSPSPTPVESFPPAPKGETDEARAVRLGWEEYERQLDRYMHDVNLHDFSALVRTTDGDETEFVLSSIEAYRARGQALAGELAFRAVEVSAARATNDGQRVATLRVCKDATRAHIVSAETGERVPPQPGFEWVPTVRLTYTLRQLPSGRWVVIGGEMERATC